MLKPSTESPAAVGPFTILTVCTGNICRSPLSEVLLRMGLTSQDARVHSAGTHALVGSGMPAENLRIATELGVPEAQLHRARQLTVEHLENSDLILALSREHRRFIVDLHPRAHRRTFTLREFARLADAVPQDALPSSSDTTATQDWRRAVEAAAQFRGTLLPPRFPEDDDVIDPYHREAAVYELSAQQQLPAVASTLNLLRRAARAEA